MHCRSAVACVVALGVVACREPPVSEPTLRIAVPFEVSTLDPHAEDKLSHFAILANIYEPLVAMDGQMSLRPALAESWSNPDPLTWVFRLRHDVAFHDGRRVTAAAVAHSLERLLGDESLEVRHYLQGVEQVKVVDPATVLIRTRDPSRILLNKLSFVPIVPAGAGAQELAATADGTGPYRLRRWTPGRSVELARNQAYWGGPRAIEQVEFLLGRGPDEALEDLRRGRVQLAECDSKKAEVEVGRMSERSVLRHDNLFVKYLGFDLARTRTPYVTGARNPFLDPRVREALHVGIDRHRLVRDLWNYAVPATQPIPRFIFGFNPRISEPIQDRDEARALLGQAGFAGGFEVVLDSRRVFGEAADIVADELAALGIRAQVRSLADAEFFAALGAGDASLWLNRFGCPTGDASDFLEGLVHSRDAARSLGANNYGGYVSPALDRQIEASDAIEDPEARRNAIQGILAAVMQELVIVPLYNDQDVYGIDDRLDWTPRADSYLVVSEMTWKE